ncbi:outer membrane lipoprotein carrier protein LolA [Halosquirtibacter xylanolyticus]|uniref:LolA family protein n=1 Tax=Halosquirtibacter xylanolyticus TaxID=3374599 RepID=UPI003749FECF|nr:outer membrane lipoprotein carrier protein LolA [Prolixibacteraceae bacterium]
MKNVLLLFTILLSITVSYAQTDGKSIIDKFTKQLESYPSIEASFDFTLENKEAEISDTNSGKLVIKGEKYRLYMLGMEIYSDGKTSYSFMPNTNEVNITNVDGEEEGAVDPAKMFRMYKEGMQVNLLSSTKKGSITEYKIELTPSTEDNFVKLIVYITSDNRLNKAVTYAVDGNIYTININQMITDKDFKDTYFKFNESDHAGVDVIDMR